jgi:hypothetical protein
MNAVLSGQLYNGLVSQGPGTLRCASYYRHRPLVFRLLLRGGRTVRRFETLRCPKSRTPPECCQRFTLDGGIVQWRRRGPKTSVNKLRCAGWIPHVRQRPPGNLKVCGEPAVHDEYLARDVGGLVRRQERRRSRYFGRVSPATQGCSTANPTHHRGILCLLSI